MVNKDIWFHRHADKSLLCIPKNGSSTFRALFDDDSRYSFPYGPVAVVIREPLDRFISAFNEIMRMNKYKDQFNDQSRLFASYVADMAKYGPWDFHQLPQAHFFQSPLVPDDAEFFSFDRLDRVASFFGLDLNGVHENKSEAARPVVTADQLAIINDIYAEDVYTYNELKQGE